jgi:hypothetical protein
MYHGDPIRPEGILVFTLFGHEMVDKLCSMGFAVKIHRLHAPSFGILGHGAIVFEATKKGA